jgi:hypothetical protein
MTKQKYNPFDNVSILKKVIVVTGIFVSLFGGMFASIVAIDNFKNYDKPYLFGFTFGTIGLLTGLITAKRLKSKILINQKMQQNYSQLTIFILAGFIGLFLLLGQHANTILSTNDKCDNYSVVDKVFRKGGFRRVELNILVINVDGVYHRYITKSNYWQTISTGQQINACIYKSRIGFDYLKLTEEK